jgi:hypothetical protein
LNSFEDLLILVMHFRLFVFLGSRGLMDQMRDWWITSTS